MRRRIVIVVGHWPIVAALCLVSAAAGGERMELPLRETFQGLLQKGGKRFVLNLGRVGYVDSSGLGEIVACKKRALEHDGDVRLLNPSAQVFEILQLSRLTEVFQIFRDEDKAVGSF